MVNYVTTTSGQPTTPRKPHHFYANGNLLLNMKLLTSSSGSCWIGSRNSSHPSLPCSLKQRVQKRRKHECIYNKNCTYQLFNTFNMPPSSNRETFAKNITRPFSTLAMRLSVNSTCRLFLYMKQLHSHQGENGVRLVVSGACCFHGDQIHLPSQHKSFLSEN